MKNVFLVLALMFTASFTFASNEIIEVSDNAIVESSLAEEDLACFTVNFSCGISGTACGDDLGEILDLVSFVDDLLCGTE